MSNLQHIGEILLPKTKASRFDTPYSYKETDDLMRKIFSEVKEKKDSDKLRLGGKIHDNDNAFVYFHPDVWYKVRRWYHDLYQESKQPNESLPWHLCTLRPRWTNETPEYLISII